MADIVPLGDDDPTRTAALRLVVGGQAGPRVADTRTTPAAGRPADPVSRNLDLLLRTVQAQGLGIEVGQVTGHGSALRLPHSCNERNS